MEYTRLGKTGLEVSRICMGCMTFGIPDRGQHPWTLDEAESRPIIKRALDLGINFFDTANAYSDGTSEEIVGRALKDFARREDVVIATKVFFPLTDKPNAGGLSRKSIMYHIDASLKRLGTDYVDLYQIHRWDYETPIEETLEALHDLVKAGKVRYIGASSMYAWQFAKALYTADQHGWTRFVSMQNYLNLIYREEEREMLPLCEAEGIGVIPWSPLARGKLTRDWDDSTKRQESDEIAKKLYADVSQTDKDIATRVKTIANKHNVSRAQVALAWVLQQQAVAAPIIGTSKISHLDDAVAALSLKLDAEELAYLEALYLPHPVAGHS